jgi:lipid-binding SYLF domain-containing protein
VRRHVYADLCVRVSRTKPERRRRGNRNEAVPMKKVMLFFAMLSLGTLCWAGSAREDATERLENATTVLHEIMGMPDKGIPEEVLEHAKCVAVIPHMVKGGFIFGGKGGKGVATCRTAKGWSAPAFITISGGNWGLQIGVEAVDVVMIIQNEKGMQRLLSSNFQVGGDASAAAGPVGRHAEAGTDWKMDTEILTYSRAKGAFAGLTLEGASIRQDNDSRHAMYGRKVTTRALLLGKVPAPAAAGPFLAEIRGAKAQAVAEGKAEDKSEARAEAKAGARAEAKGNVSVTGCLQRGDEAGQFSIFGEDGKAWGLRSSTVKLEDHVGHQVMVTGSPTREAKAEEKKEGQVQNAGQKEELGELRVTSLKMISQRCTK